MVPVTYRDEAPTRVEMRESLSQLQRRFPISSLTAIWHEGLDYEDCFTSTRDTSWVWFDKVFLNEAIEDLRARSSRYSDFIWCGMLTLRSGSNISPLGRAEDIPAGSCWSLTNYSDEEWEQRDPPSTDGKLKTKAQWSHYLDKVFTHEVSHCLGRSHIESGRGEGYDENYPFHPTGIINIVGFDSFDMLLYRQDNHFDMMTYSFPHWLSEYTYRGLLNYLQFQYPPEKKPTQGLKRQSEPYWMVSAHLLLDASGLIAEATFSPLMEVSNPVIPESSPGAYRLELLNAQGEILDFVEFRLNLGFTDHGCCSAGEIGAEDDPTIGFVKYLPKNPQAAAIVLLATGVEVDRIEPSANAPSVHLLSPNGGQSLDGEFIISWNGSDLDGDDLIYQVDWSWDAGVTWEPISGRLSSTTLAMHTDSLPGGTECLVRVSVSDGFFTAADSSDAIFTVPDSPPVVGIIDPKDGQVFYPGDTIFFSGDGSDPETGSLSGESLTWLSDLDELLGYGAQISSATLYASTHTITLIARDTAGNESTSSIRLFILPFDTSRVGKAGDWNGDGKMDYLDLFEFSMHWKKDTTLQATDEEELLQLLKLMHLLR